MLKAENVTKIYRTKNGKQTAVDNVSITIGDDSVTVIVGESGSGKSTLSRMLSYIEHPDSGQILLDGTPTDCRTAKAKRRCVQLVMQDAASSLDPHQTAEQVLDEPLMLLLKMKKPQRQQRISELIDMVRFPKDRLKNKVSELSGGQQKRLCIARALAAEPKYIILTKPSADLM